MRSPYIIFSSIGTVRSTLWRSYFGINGIVKKGCPLAIPAPEVSLLRVSAEPAGPVACIHRKHNKMTTRRNETVDPCLVKRLQLFGLLIISSSQTSVVQSFTPPVNRISEKVETQQAISWYPTLIHAPFGWHGGTKSTKRRHAHKNNNDKDDKKINVPGYDFFQGDGPYVPSGLSRQGYEKIRKKEAANQAKMNYGAWGPRFKQTGVPDGDWMVMPALWTLGAVRDNNDNNNSRAGGNNVGSNANPGGGIRRFLSNTVRFAKANAAGFFLGYLLVDTLTSCYFMYKIQELTWKKMAFVIVHTILWNVKKQHHHHYHPIHSATSSSSGGHSVTLLIQVYAIKVVVATVLTPFVNWVLERQNRRRLWTKGKTVALTVMLNAALLFLWGFILSSFPR